MVLLSQISTDGCISKLPNALNVSVMSLEAVGRRVWLVVAQNQLGCIGIPIGVSCLDAKKYEIRVSVFNESECECTPPGSRGGDE